MKIILMLVIFIGLTYVGVQIKNKLAYKKELYGALILFCESYKQEVGFLKTEVKSVAFNCSKNSKILLPVIESYFNKDGLINVLLNDVDKQELVTFLNGLGKKDVEGELNYVDFYKNIFTQKEKKSIELFNKYGTFSIKISALLALLLCLLFA